ncbi:MAG TPA: hypothetical protein VNO26_02455 [Candidatus Limnocylindria bacterium]|nr:hypothetical protein [Candidatus Limnocylindria bacterium]
MRPTAFAVLVAFACSGCAAIVTGPMQDVRIESNPPGANVTLYPQQSQRGPLFLKEEEIKITTPATVRLHRDTTYRAEFQKSGYVIAEKKIVSKYNWALAPIACGPCEAVGELPTYDMKGRALPVRFAEAAFYEYPVGAVRSVGGALRILSPEAIMGDAFKLKSEDDGYWDHWHGVGTPTVSVNLSPIQ